MRLALIQMNSQTAARDENVARACAFVDEAAGRGAEFAVLPEFFNVEYFPQYRDYRYMDSAEPDDGYTQSHVKAKAREHKICIVSTIFEVARPGLYYDTAMLIGPDGEIAGKYRKVHPAAYLSLEKIYFRGGADEQIVCADIEREVVEQARRRFHFSRDRRPDAYDAITRPMEELQR